MKHTSNFIRRLLAMLCLGAVLLAAAGCAHAPADIAVQNGTAIPIGYYSAQQMLTRVQLENAYGSGYYDYLAQSAADGSGRTNGEVLNENYRTAFETLWVLKLKTAELGLSMDSYRSEIFENEYGYFKKMFRTENDYRHFLSVCGLSEEAHKEIYKETVYDQDLVYAYYFDPETGVERFTDEQVRAYFDSLVQYSVAHILFYAASADAAGNPLSEQEIAANKEQAKARAEEVLAKIKAGEVKFDSAMNEYSDDPQLENYPGGYGFVENEEGFPTCFTLAAKELREGEMGLYESEMGWHIIRRVTNDSVYECQQALYSRAMGSEKMSEKIDQWRAALSFEYNEEALAYCDFTAENWTNVILSQS